MSVSKKIIWAVALLIWLFSFIVMIIALVGKAEGNPFKEHALIISIGHMAVTGFIRIAYKQLKKRNRKPVSGATI